MVTQPPFSIEIIASLPFDENSYVVYRPDRHDCLVIDPGFQPDKIVDFLERKKLTPAAILNTHGHSDHIAGNAELKQHWPDAPLIIGRGDVPMLSDPSTNLSGLAGLQLISPQPDRTLDNGEELEMAGFRLRVIEVPGHTPGHIVYLCENSSPQVIFGGDVLFAGGVGRGDFPGGDIEELKRNIRQKLFPLPDETLVYPGHGPPTTIGREKDVNPFVGETAEDGRW